MNRCSFAPAVSGCSGMPYHCPCHCQTCSPNPHLVIQAMYDRIRKVLNNDNLTDSEIYDMILKERRENLTKLEESVIRSVTTHFIYLILLSVSLFLYEEEEEEAAQKVAADKVANVLISNKHSPSSSSPPCVLVSGMHYHCPCQTCSLSPYAMIKANYNRIRKVLNNDNLTDIEIYDMILKERRENLIKLEESDIKHETFQRVKKLMKEEAAENVAPDTAEEGAGEDVSADAVTTDEGAAEDVNPKLVIADEGVADVHPVASVAGVIDNANKLFKIGFPVISAKDGKLRNLVADKLVEYDRAVPQAKILSITLFVSKNHESPTFPLTIIIIPSHHRKAIIVAIVHGER
ncbi:hypothetical protein RIF29_23907 [Crotalaria pallida]|uniref:Uncharacterized protein n=1 Tax=Crotalaria pallida TaxID=3830 RepID=A0AAN9EJK4_CROPI